MFYILSVQEESRLTRILNVLSEFCVKYGLKLIGAVLVLVIGIWAVKLLMKLITRSRLINRVDKDARGFVCGIIRVVLYLLVVLTVVAILGVPMASIVAVIASCGVAIGLALQGSLSNFAGGLMLVIFKPFREGDYISAGGHEGTVEDIGVFNTKLTTVDNRCVVVPNSALSNTTVVNYTRFGTRRVDHYFRTDTEVDSEKVISVLSRMADSQSLKLADKPAEVRLDSIGEGFAKYHVKVWCKTEDYWALYYALLSDGKRALEENGIRIPPPRMEVRNEN